MSKWDKLITRICNLSKDLRFDELRKVLESYGYEMNTLRRESIVLEVYNKKQLVLLFVLLSINNTNCFWRNGIRLIKSSKFPVSIENICLIYIMMICF